MIIICGTTFPQNVTAPQILTVLNGALGNNGLLAMHVYMYIFRGGGCT